MTTLSTIQPPTPAEPPAGPVPMTQLLPARIAALARRRWAWLAVVAAFWAAVAYPVSSPFSKQTWEASGTLLHTPIPLPEGERGLYTPPDLPTLASLAKSRPTLEAIAEEFRLPPETANLLDKVISVKASRQTATVTIVAQWGDPEDGAGIVNSAMERLMSEAARIRQAKIDEFLGDSAGRLEECKKRLADAQNRLDAFQAEWNVLDLKGDVEQTRNEVYALMTARETARGTEASLLAQAAQLAKHLTDLRSEEAKNEESRKFEASDESVADNRRRQDRLRELIEEERKIQELRPLLVGKQAEVDRLRKLRAIQAVTLDELGRAEVELKALSARVNDNERIARWKEELERIDKVVVPKGQAKSLGSPIIQQTLAKKLDIDLALVGVRRELDRNEQRLDERRRHLAELQQGQRRTRALETDVEALTAERQRIEGREAGLRQVQSPNSREFAIVARAKAGPHPLSSNRKVIFGGVWAALVLASAGLVLGRDLIRDWPAGPTVALRWRLSVLNAALPGRSAWAGARRTALRLRQHADAFGAVVLMPEAGDRLLRAPAYRGLAECLARRDERVLVIDLRPAVTPGDAPIPCLPEKDGSAADGPGLSEFLAFECEPAEAVRPTALAAVDLLPAGSVEAGDLAATHRMRELLEWARGRYSLILVGGLWVADAVDLEIWLAHSQGVVVVLGERRAGSQGLEAALRRAREQGTPVLGAMVVPQAGRGH